MKQLTMSKEEREAFLAELHVGVFAVADGDNGPLAAPIWYGYEPGGEVWFSTGRSSAKAKLLQPGARATFIVQDEQPPYRYVSVEGPITLSDCDIDQHIKPMAYRYLGQEEGDQYLAESAGDPAEMVVVRIRPEVWRTQDYGKFANP